LLTLNVAAVIALLLHWVFPYSYPEVFLIEGEEELHGGSDSEQVEAVTEHTKEASKEL